MPLLQALERLRWRDVPGQDLSGARDAEIATDVSNVFQAREERLRLIERAAHEAVEDTPKPSNVVESRVQSKLGLMADEPELVDEICALAYQARTQARMRSFDD